MMRLKQTLAMALSVAFLGAAGCETDRGPRPDLSTVPPPTPAEEPFEPAGGDAGEEFAYANAEADAGPVPIEAEAGGARGGGGSRTYIVQRGDTLWSIANRELGDGQRWRDIRDANPTIDADNLPIGAELRLPR